VKNAHNIARGTIMMNMVKNNDLPSGPNNNLPSRKTSCAMSYSSFKNHNFQKKPLYVMSDGSNPRICICENAQLNHSS